MTRLIAETAWHHEGDFAFMHDLVSRLSEESAADVIKMHITLNLDEYMSRDHQAYEMLRSWTLSATQWDQLIDIVKRNGKQLMLLLNDTTAIDFASQYKPELVELHSVCLNVPTLQRAVFDRIDDSTKVVIGVGGCTLQEIDAAINFFNNRKTVLMFGFQNYPTLYENINLKKIRKIQSLYANKKFGYADHTAWDEPNNELITLMVAANGMDYIEKHVTIAFGHERCDYSAAISIDMFNQLAKKLDMLDRIYGNGSIALNSGEKAYSQYGPMKMAAIVARDIRSGETLAEEDVVYCRTGKLTNMSQIDVLGMIGHKVKNDLNISQVINWECFEE